MSLRLHEIHPAIAHYPIALVPVAILADLLGHRRNDPVLMEMGRRLMPAAAITAGLTGMAGLAAQGAVRTGGASQRLLVTHRTLNIAATTATAALAVWRSRRLRPNRAYLAAGLVSAAIVTYSAYLGGKMVYGHGVGVEPDGVDIRLSPKITSARISEAAAGATARGAKDTAQDLLRGELVPHLTTG